MKAWIVYKWWNSSVKWTQHLSSLVPTRKSYQSWKIRETLVMEIIYGRSTDLFQEYSEQTEIWLKLVRFYISHLQIQDHSLILFLLLLLCELLSIMLSWKDLEILQSSLPLKLWKIWWKLRLSYLWSFRKSDSIISFEWINNEDISMNTNTTLYFNLKVISFISCDCQWK